MRQAGYPLQGPKRHLHPSPQLQTASLCHPWASKALGRPARAMQAVEPWPDRHCHLRGPVPSGPTLRQAGPAPVEQLQHRPS